MKIIRLQVPSELGYEKVVMDAVGVLAAQMGFSEHRIEDIKIVTAEACTNAIEHGNNLEADLPVRVEIRQGADLEILIMDSGRQCLPAQLPTPGEGPQHRHWGIFLIRRLVDEMEFSTTPEGGNCIRMRIHTRRK
jgi:serine/threonine-protein kinase RsbW